jgi:hypothetical protein
VLAVAGIVAHLPCGRASVDAESRSCR